MKNYLKPTFVLAGALFTASSFLNAGVTEPVSTDPVGYVTIDVAPGNGSDKSTNIVSLPLLAPAEDITGESLGVISAVTSGSIQVADAGWGAGELSVAATPFLIRVTSGNAEGLTLPISTTTANTATEVFVDNGISGQVLDLTSLGIIAGTDRFEVVPADTLSSLLGTPETTGIVGGASAADADTVVVFNNGWQVYFYSTTKAGWVKSQFGLPLADDLILHPDYAMIYQRLGVEDLSFTVVGRVPTTERSVAIKNSGVTFLASGWPTETTLANSGIQNLSGWVSGSAAADADQVIIRSASGWNTFFYDGSDWKKSTFGLPVANSEVIGLGEGLIINKSGTSSGLSQLSQILPYTL